jgi:hypothetical protein
MLSIGSIENKSLRLAKDMHGAGWRPKLQCLPTLQLHKRFHDNRLGTQPLDEGDQVVTNIKVVALVNNLIVIIVFFLIFFRPSLLCFANSALYGIPVGKARKMRGWTSTK